MPSIQRPRSLRPEVRWDNAQKARINQTADLECNITLILLVSLPTSDNYLGGTFVSDELWQSSMIRLFPSCRESGHYNCVCLSSRFTRNEATPNLEKRKQKGPLQDALTDSRPFY